MNNILMIKVKNSRGGGSLFHYAHFLCDCLFPEVINDIFKYEEVVREKNIKQTLGNFSKIYMDVMMIKNTELLSDQFNDLKVDIVLYPKKENYCDKIHVDKFRNFIFTRYKIDNLKYNDKYPEVVLVKRSDRIKLINDEYLEKINTNITTGKERREIDNIDTVEKYLQDKYTNKFRSIFFEHISFEEQVMYFNNARLIICAHGAVMSNMFFCKESTKIIDITCGCKWKFFDKLSEILNLEHIRCNQNTINEILNCIKNNEI